MVRIPRTVLIIGALLLITAGGALTAANLWLASWVPVKGKALVETQLNHALPLRVTIGTMRYSVWQGFLLDDVRAADPATGTTWVAAPHLQARLGVLRFLLQRQVAFRMKTALTAPGEIFLIVSGRYGLAERRLVVDLLTLDADVERLIPEAAALLPNLKRGRARLKVRVDWQPDRAPVFTGRLVGTALAWEQAPLRITGNVLVEGTAAPPDDPAAPWTIDVKVDVERGELEGPRPLDTVQKVAGTIRLSHDTVTIERLHGMALDLPWEMRADLKYDLPAGGLTINTLSGRIQGHPVMARGSLQFKPPATMNLVVEAEADWALAKKVLPADSPVQPVAGSASVHVELGGLLTHPTWTGTAAFTEAAIGLRAWPSSVERLSGTVRFTDQELSTDRLTCVAAGRPVTISGALTAFRTTPRFVGQVGVAEARLTMEVTARPEAVVLQTAELSMGASRLRAKGRISRLRDAPSELSVAGTVRLTDLSQIPWVNVSVLTPWQLEGDVEIQARLSGPLEQPQALSVSGLIQSEQLTIKGVPIRAVNAEIEQGTKQWSLRLAGASIAGGKLTGEFLLERSEQARYLLEADLTTVDLQQLAASIPAWRGRDLQGTMSAHASFVGGWKDRSTMQGDGWLHAEGARLGEVPLLDRVFHGVFGALADRLGLTGLRKAQIVKVTGQWRIAQARVWTEDLHVTGLSGTDPIALLIRGSVGLDKTLDLVVEPELSEQLLTQAPNTSAIAGTILKVMGGLERARGVVGRHRISGTIDNPQYKFEVRLDQILNQSLPAGIGQFLDSLR